MTEVATADNSLKTAVNNITELLTSAGQDGLHSDDIHYLLGFQEKSELINQLKYLKRRGEIADLPGDRWKKLDKAAADEAEALLMVLKEDESTRPKINLPGSGKFCSYKNSLQEYAQKKSQPVPVYRTSKLGTEYYCSVTFSVHNYRCPTGTLNPKEAESRCAYEVLVKLGYLEEKDYIPTTGDTKRKASITGNNGTNDEKKAKLTQENMAGKSTKSQLQEHCQKSKIDIPTYTTVGLGDTKMFQTTVLVYGVQYQGECKAKKKEAEASAAQAALIALSLMR